MTYLHEHLILIDPDFLDNNRKPRFTTPSAYIDWVTRIIRTINRSEVGRILLKSIKFHRKTVRISPIKDNIFDPGIALGATTEPGEAPDLVFNRSARPVLNAFGFLPPPIRAVIRFTPHYYADGGVHNRFYEKHHHYAPTEESVLLHELVHAFRSVSGKYNTEPMTHGGLNKFDSFEEFFAVIVENIFQSELKRNIRSDHHGYSNLDTHLAGSFEFFKVSKQAFGSVKRFCDENPGLTRALACVKVPFNPLAAFYKDRRKAEALSASHEASMRDIRGFLQELTPDAWQ